MRTVGISSSTSLILLLVCGAGLVEDACGQDDALFERRIRPLLVEHCQECHGTIESDVRGGLVLVDPASIRSGGDGGPVVVPGHPEESPLHVAVSYEDPEFQMPPAGRLSDQEIADIRKWIETGATMPADDEGVRTHSSGKDEEPYDWDSAREHWAYRPVRTTEPPAVQDEAWCRNEIDRFILERLEKTGLSPAPEADRRVLLRRAYFDLVGLPPTPEEVDAFVADESPDAWSRVIDRLLASPHYGERWGRHWLDVARYADSNGLDENTAFGNAWRYRDWVVRALNSDKRYDEFVVEQIAGDLLPESSERQQSIDRLVATGFLSLGPKVLAEPDKEKMQIDIVDEQLDVIGQAFLGQTIGCARCHNHKFDPITARDYYAMAGILYSTRTMQSLNTVARVLERDLAPTEEIRLAKEHAERTLENAAALEAVLLEGGARLQRSWAEQTTEAMLASTEFTTTPIVREAEDFDGSNLNVNFENWGPGIGILHSSRPDEIQYVEYRVDSDVRGAHQVWARYSSAQERPLEVHVNGTKVAGDFCKSPTGSFLPDTMDWTMVEVELPAGESMIRFQRGGSFPHLDRIIVIGPGEAEAFVAESEQISARTGVPPELLRRWATALAAEPVFAPWRSLAVLEEAEFESQAGVLVDELARRYGEGESTSDSMSDRSGVGPRDKKFVRSVLVGPPPRDLRAFAERWQGMASLVLASWERHRTTAEGGDAERLPDEAQEAYRTALIGQRGVLRIDSGMSVHFEPETGVRVEELEVERALLEEATPRAIDMGIVVEDGTPTDLPIFIRGDHTNQSEQVVPRGFLTVLDGIVDGPVLPADGSGRLELARWIIDQDNPLTARVAVNRAWHGHFGRGIVATPSNFGIRGLPPTHPELLDWLAGRFMDDGWSLKALHRLIMHSASYRMSGAGDERAYEIDPDNQLLWHHAPRRLEVEPIRDSLLAVGGSLDRTVGGSLLRSAGFGYVTNDQSASNERYDSPRRALYLPVIRNDMYPLFSTFDYADSSVPIDARPSTVVSQQALFMLNSPLVGAQAQQLAEQLLEDGTLPDDRARITRAYEICFSRPPGSEEIDRAADFLDRIARGTESAPAVAWPATMGGSEMIDADHHAWRSLCQVLMSSNEFIYVQ